MNCPFNGAAKCAICRSGWTIDHARTACFRTCAPVHAIITSCNSIAGSGKSVTHASAGLLTHMHLGCKDERAAARMLGYTQASWDNDSGLEKQPASSEKYWGQLTHDERAAAAVLGYNDPNWDVSPASMRKTWIELTEHERAAAQVLGYEVLSWDNHSGKQRKPTSMARA